MKNRILTISLYSLAIFGLYLSLFSFSQARAGELVYFGSSACPSCESWDEEIGSIYPKTDEAKILPLRKVSIHDDRPNDLEFIKGIRYTPTFIAVEDGKEVGRIIGYPNEILFWDLMASMMNEVNDYRSSACLVKSQAQPEYC